MTVRTGNRRGSRRITDLIDKGIEAL